MNTLVKIIICTIAISAISCKKLVEIESPITKFDASKIYRKDENAIAVLTALYQEMSADGYAQGANSMQIIAGLSADELTDYQAASSLHTAAYQNKFTSSSAPYFWTRLYFFIYTTNTAIQGIKESETLSPDIKEKLMGEAKFMRAFFYFHLANFWGDIPLPITNDYLTNSVLRRSKKEEVYRQIIGDLKDAETLLGNDYVLSDLRTPTTERIRPNKWVAKAFLARVQLYVKEYDQAEKNATEIINQKGMFSLSILSNVFLNNSQETIWQIQAIDPSWNTFVAKGFVLNSAPNFAQPVSLSPSLVNSFELGDKRKLEWVNSYTEGNKLYNYAYKYKVVEQNAPKSEALIVMRLAEMYLIRAECRNETGNTTEAISDLNTLRTRARATVSDSIPFPLPNLSNTLSVDAIRNAILHERQVELFTEWGHRWFDLKRTGLIDEKMQTESPKKGSSWNPNFALFPIPEGELITNPNITQNLGY